MANHWQKLTTRELVGFHRSERTSILCGGQKLNKLNSQFLALRARLLDFDTSVLRGSCNRHSRFLQPSVITLNPAIHYQFKTGQRDWPKT